MENEAIGKIFLGGSKTIGRLPERAANFLDLFIESNEHLLIGDCHGADLAIQTYLYSKGYENVTIYYAGDKCRFNVGNWHTKQVPVDESIQGYERYQKKDIEMINDCNGALLLWDTQSRGTKNNIIELKKRGLPIFTYRSDINDFRVTRRKNHN